MLIIELYNHSRFYLHIVYKFIASMDLFYMDAIEDVFVLTMDVNEAATLHKTKP